MKAIETVYQGYRMRSRLEARWAVFFDRIGIPWEYEKEGYILEDDTWYLPDFWLPEQEYWIEIKGQAPTSEEREKALRLAQASNQYVFMFEGSFSIPDPDNGIYPIAANAYFPSHTLEFVGKFSPTFSWCHCGGCGRWIIKDNVTAYNPGFKTEYCQDSGVCETYCPISQCANYLWFKPPALIAAYTAARQARFEHGEGR